jgi:hypothetical protein
MAVFGTDILIPLASLLGFQSLGSIFGFRSSMGTGVETWRIKGGWNRLGGGS